MMYTFKLQVFLMRLFWRIKTAYADTFTINHDLCSPLSLMSANSQKSNFVGFSCFSHVLQIAKSSNLSQISKRIIQLVSVDVINMAIWHVASYMKPCQSMSQSFNVVNSNRNVSGAMNRTSNFSNKIGSVMIFAPSKDTCLHVVIQRFTQMFNGNVKFGSHDVQFTIKATQ